MTDIERNNVHAFYSNNAPRFSITRGYLWKGVKAFLNDTLPSQRVLEVGCGNGKNLRYLQNKNITVVGVDVCEELLDICRDSNLDVMYGDATDLPYTDANFDKVFSVAVIHHLSTPERRKKAVQELQRVLTENGKMFFSVWAVEQPQESRRSFTEGDNMVPWKDPTGELKGYRYYHVYSEQSFKKFIVDCGLDPNNIKYEFGNWIYTN